MAKNIRNVLFITADQWRADCLSALGHPLVRTPNLDRLAAEGTLFRRHFAQATPCGPGRASLYTGLYLHNHRQVVNGCPLDRRHSNVALEARCLGYDPVLFGHSDSGADPREMSVGDPELKSYEGVLPGMTPWVRVDESQHAWRAHLKARGYELPSDPDDVFNPAPGPGEAGHASFAPAFYAAEDSNTAFLTDEVMRYISVRTEESWFVHLSHWAPHPPFIAPRPYHSLYDPAKVPNARRHESPAREAAEHPYLEFYLWNQRGTRMCRANEVEDRLAFTEDERRQLAATYFGMISEVDAQVGRLIEFLKAEGLYENTLIVFTSDHGEQLGDHWMYAKYGYFDQAFAIPLIVRDPAGESARFRGRQVEAFTEAVDVMPSIVDWLGGEIPVQIDGCSLLPWTRGQTPRDWRREAHWEFDFRDMAEARGEPILGLSADACNLACIRGARYKYVHFAGLEPAFYDLEEDPDEMRNLARDPAYRDLLLEHAQKLLSWRMTTEERQLTHLRLTHAAWSMRAWVEEKSEPGDAVAGGINDRLAIRAERPRGRAAGRFRPASRPQPRGRHRHRQCPGPSGSLQRPLGCRGSSAR